MINGKLNIGLRGHDVLAEDLSELAFKLNEYGIKNVQLVLKKSCKEFSEGMFSPSFAMQIGDTFSKQNVDISVLGCYINPSNTNETALKKETDYFVESLKYARYMNAGVVGLETGFIGDTCVPENNHTEEAYQHLLRTMRYLTSKAEKLGVTIAVEAVSAFVIDSPQKMRRLVDDLNSANIAVIFDALNLITAENYENRDEIIKTAFELLSKEIAVIHLKDFKIKNGIPIQCPIGEGIMNIPLILSLASNKPNIPIILEETKENVLLNVISELKNQKIINVKYFDKKEIEYE